MIIKNTLINEYLLDQRKNYLYKILEFKDLIKKQDRFYLFLKRQKNQ